MQLRKYRWSKDYESAEEELVALFAAKKIQPEVWHGEPGQVFAARADDSDKTLWCAEGSLTLTANGKAISLQPGDTLELPSQTVYDIVTGINGCVCYESPQRTDNARSAAT